MLTMINLTLFSPAAKGPHHCVSTWRIYVSFAYRCRRIYNRKNDCIKLFMRSQIDIYGPIKWGDLAISQLSFIMISCVVKVNFNAIAFLKFWHLSSRKFTMVSTLNYYFYTFHMRKFWWLRTLKFKYFSLWIWFVWLAGVHEVAGSLHSSSDID
jgi:hypothetical protein